jgi:hypothetical protein
LEHRFSLLKGTDGSEISFSIGRVSTGGIWQLQRCRCFKVIVLPEHNQEMFLKDSQILIKIV